MAAHRPSAVSNSNSWPISYNTQMVCVFDWFVLFFAVVSTKNDITKQLHSILTILTGKLRVGEWPKKSFNSLFYTSYMWKNELTTLDE